jgi:hypothetical protein
MLLLQGLELRQLGRPARSQSLYRLSYFIRHNNQYSSLFQITYSKNTIKMLTNICGYHWAGSFDEPPPLFCSY